MVIVFPLSHESSEVQRLPYVAIHLDRETARFLKNREPAVHAGPEALERHEKGIWRRLIGQVRCKCARCGRVYWVDGRRVPKSGARTKCGQCGNSICLQRPDLALAG